MRLSTVGATRWVIFAFGLVFKFPRPTSWEAFIVGLLANMQERKFGRCGWPEFCPVLWSIAGGWLVVMPQARVLSGHEFRQREGEIAAMLVIGEHGYCVPAEMKADSWGYLDGRLVAVDYG